MGKRVFVRLPGSGRARIITDEENVRDGRLRLGTDYVSRVLGKGHQPDDDGEVRIPISSSKEIK